MEKIFSDYGRIERQLRLEFQGAWGPGGATSQAKRESWWGFRLEKKEVDVHFVAQFLKDGIVFSMLKPYLHWERFSKEGLRFWKAFCDFAKPGEIQRLGVRFINRIDLDRVESVKGYLRLFPQPPEGLESRLADFFHRSSYEVEAKSVGVHVVTALQSSSGKGGKLGLILDVDAFTLNPVEIPDEAEVLGILEDLRETKNRAFFGSLTPEAVEKLERGEV